MMRDKRVFISFIVLVGLFFLVLIKNSFISSNQAQKSSFSSFVEKLVKSSNFIHHFCSNSFVIQVSSNFVFIDSISFSKYNSFICLSILII